MYVQRGNGFVNLSSLDLRNNANMQTAANVVGHYAREVGIKYNQNGGTGTVGISTLHNTDGNGPGVLAATIRGNINMKVANGKLHPEMYNTYNLQGTLLHENEHKKDYEHGINKASALRHAEIIIKEMSTNNFAKGTESYQKGQIGQFMNYVESIKDSGVSASALIRIIQKANSALENSNWKIYIENNEVKYRRR